MNKKQKKINFSKTLTRLSNDFSKIILLCLSRLINSYLRKMIRNGPKNIFLIHFISCLFQIRRIKYIIDGSIRLSNRRIIRIVCVIFFFLRSIQNLEWNGGIPSVKKRFDFLFIRIKKAPLGCMDFRSNPGGRRLKSPPKTQ